MMLVSVDGRLAAPSVVSIRVRVDRCCLRPSASRSEHVSCVPSAPRASHDEEPTEPSPPPCFGKATGTHRYGGPSCAATGKMRELVVSGLRAKPSIAAGFAQPGAADGEPVRGLSRGDPWSAAAGGGLPLVRELRSRTLLPGERPHGIADHLGPSERAREQLGASRIISCLPLERTARPHALMPCVFLQRSMQGGISVSCIGRWPLAAPSRPLGH